MGKSNFGHGAVNMIPVTDLNPVTLTVRTGSSTALNVRGASYALT